MNENFSSVIESLHPSFQSLMAMTPVKFSGLPRDVPSQGVYLFSENERHLYVGRSNSMRRRFGQHCRDGSQQNQAVLAFKIARQETGLVQPAYVQGPNSRIGLLSNEDFASAFSKAKHYLRQLDIRYVQETDQRRQALLEMYCAISLNCPYNDFGTS